MVDRAGYMGRNCREIARERHWPLDAVKINNANSGRTTSNENSQTLVADMTLPLPISHRNGPGAQSRDYLFGLPNRRSLSIFCSALTPAATFRTRWVVIAALDSRRDARKSDADGGLLSVRSGWCSRKFSIRYANRHSGQRPTAQPSILLHNVVCHRRGSSTLVIANRNIWTIKHCVSAWDVRRKGGLRCVS
jgi:hypothetical protein